MSRGDYGVVNLMLVEFPNIVGVKFLFGRTIVLVRVAYKSRVTGMQIIVQVDAFGVVVLSASLVGSDGYD
jgi:hypothetical protein